MLGIASSPRLRLGETEMPNQVGDRERNSTCPALNPVLLLASYVMLGHLDFRLHICYLAQSGALPELKHSVAVQPLGSPQSSEKTEM
jgi:hypothetical protein